MKIFLYVFSIFCSFFFDVLANECNETVLNTSPELSTRIEQNQTQLDHYNLSGGWSGNGGDFSKISQNPWFFGTKAINYCIVVKEDFPISEYEIKNLINSSIKKWKSFFKKYNLNQPIGTQKSQFKRRLEFLDKIPKSINFNYTFSNDCETSQLQFYFGKENKIINDYQKFATEHPFGFAIRNKYDHKTYHNRGLIWIKQNQNKDLVEHVILHELGHVHGMEHDSVFIMRDTMAEELNNHKNLIVNQVETDYWPYRFSEGSSLFIKPSRKLRGQGPWRNRKSCPQNTFRAGHLSKQLNFDLELASHDCVTIELQNTKGTNFRNKLFSLKIKNHSKNKTIILKGSFPIRRKMFKDKKGPGLFSEFLVSKKDHTRKVWMKVYLDKDDHSELSGTFSHKSINLPAKLLQQNGAVLDLFIPDANSWLSLKSYEVD